jgi:hypothetical protein
MNRQVFLRNVLAGTTLRSTKAFAASDAFIDELLPAPPSGGFRMSGYWVWPPALFKAEDGRYHMFASRWSKDLGFGHWVSNSKIVRAVSDRPEGPYEYVETVLQPRKKQSIDGLITHNTRITKYKNQYLLYYMGSTYDFPVPQDREEISLDGRATAAWMNKRIGLAVADKIAGPSKRVDQPLLLPRTERLPSPLLPHP